MFRIPISQIKWFKKLIHSFRHQRTSSNKSATSYSSIGEVGTNVGFAVSSRADTKFTSPSTSSNKHLLDEGPGLNFEGMFIIKPFL